MPFQPCWRQPSSSMVRAISLCALTISTLASAGCQSSFLTTWSERRTVNEFAAAIAAEDTEQARAVMSSDFSQTILAGEESLDEFQRVWPVTGELEVVRITEVEAADREDPEIPEKIVTVKDERGWETDHRLIEDPEKGRWVVDEILMTSSHRGVSVTKTVSEQIAFAVVVREFAEAWRNGDRTQRLAHVTAACRAELEPLPDEVLNHIAGKMFPPDERTVSTEETMDEDIAIVRLRHTGGIVLLQMKRLEGEWLIDDAAYESGSEGETIPSLRRTAVAYAAATDFLRAYAAVDLEKLKKVTVSSFFKSTLKVADLKDVTLPRVEAAKNGELRLVGRTGELVIGADDQTFKISLVQTNEETDVTQGTEFRVEDVTIYKDDGQSKKNLAAALVAEPTARLFVAAMINRDLNRLKALATNDFNERVWGQIGGELLAEMPLALFQEGEREVLSILHKGATTEVTMLQAGRAMTVVLHDEAGKVKVSDVMVAVADRPSSTKTTLSQYLPLARLTHALKAGDLKEIRKHCTTDFNRSIWAQVRQLPPLVEESIRFLDAPLASLQASETQATIHLGEKDYGGMITMLKFDGEWKVNEITLIAGPEADDRLALKAMLRDQLANGTLYAGELSAPKTAAAAKMAGGIQPVGYEAPIEEDAASDRDKREPRPFELGSEAGTTLEPAALPGSDGNSAVKESADGQSGDLPGADVSADDTDATPVKPASFSGPVGAADGPAAPFDAPLW